MNARNLKKGDPILVKLFTSCEQPVWLSATVWDTFIGPDGHGRVTVNIPGNGLVDIYTTDLMEPYQYN